MSEAPLLTRRTFFALWPDQAAREALAALALVVAHDRGGRATRPENLHVTVAFLGEFGMSRLGLLDRAGAEAASAVAPFELVLDRLGGAAGGIAWLAPTTTPEPLRALHSALSRALDAGGVPVERRSFRPHATLARRCMRPPQRMATAPIAWTVDRLALVASATHANGPVYEEIAAWKLRVAEPPSPSGRRAGDEGTRSAAD